MRRLCGMVAMAVAAVSPAAAWARSPKIPPDAPYCALPDARPLVIAPVGEPFRGAAGSKNDPAATWIDGADADRDGAVNRAEMLADARRFFVTLDKNKDGRLTPEEVDGYERDVAPEIAIYGGARIDRVAGVRPDEAGYGGPRGAGRYAWLNIPQPVASSGTDMNRLIDMAEFMAAAGRRFDMLAQGRGGLRLADLTRTPFQQAIDGPCRPRPKLRASSGERPRRAGEPVRP